MLERVLIDHHATDPKPVQPALFRHGMRQLAGAVSIISIGRAGPRGGFTATSVTSFSADPPMLLVCVARASSSYPLLLEEGAFGVSVLRPDQHMVAERFAGRDGASGEDRFAGVAWIRLVTGTPILPDALAAFDCEVTEVIERASHAIVIGAVRAVRSDPSGAALLYWRGSFDRLGWSTEEASLAAGLRPY